MTQASCLSQAPSGIWCSPYISLTEKIPSCVFLLPTSLLPHASGCPNHGIICFSKPGLSASYCLLFPLKLVARLLSYVEILTSSHPEDSTHSSACLVLCKPLPLSSSLVHGMLRESFSHCEKCPRPMAGPGMQVSRREAIPCDI